MLNGLPIDQFDKDFVKYKREAVTKYIRERLRLVLRHRNLGLFCANGTGTGVAVDKCESAKWYMRAAESGSIQAQNSLGLCYEKGIGIEVNSEGVGVAVDKREAVKWMTLAAEDGDEQAQTALDLLFYTSSLG